jgi:hypothetical protein
MQEEPRAGCLELSLTAAPPSCSTHTVLRFAYSANTPYLGSHQVAPPGTLRRLSQNTRASSQSHSTKHAPGGHSGVAMFASLACKALFVAAHAPPSEVQNRREGDHD